MIMISELKTRFDCNFCILEIMVIMDHHLRDFNFTHLSNSLSCYATVLGASLETITSAS